MRTDKAALGCALAVAGAVATHAGEERAAIRATAMPPIPDRHGFAGCFAGVAGDRLIAAGGANFPDGVMPWRGGKKVWHDSVFALDLKSPHAEWKRIGALPRANGYGVTVTAGDSLILIGGGDADHNFANVTRMDVSGDSVGFAPLPPLPAPRANACGVLSKGRIHVFGGIETPASATASNSHFVFDLKHPENGWTEAPPVPGNGVMLATAAATDAGVFVMGGCSLRPDNDGKPVRTYLRDCLMFADGVWTKCPDLPRAAVGAASPAWSLGSDFLLAGGDDGLQVGGDPETHKGFSRSILRYDSRARVWSEVTGPDQPLPVTLPSASHGGAFILINGEIRPGVRTPAITKLTLAP